MTLKYVPNPIGQGKSSFDFLGQILGIISIAALAFSLIEAGKLDWLAFDVLMGFIICICSFIAFLIVEHRTERPMFPLIYFNLKHFQ